MPRLISFDIGIKNLAYCIFDFCLESEKGNKCEILDWNVLDISKTKTDKEIESESETTKKEIIFCSCVLPNKSKKIVNIICKKKAKYKKDNNYYCESHAKTSGFLFPSKEFSHSSLKKLSLPNLLEFETKYFPEHHFSVISPQKKETKIEKVERIYREIQQKSLCVLSTTDSDKKTKTLDLITIGRNLLHQLNTLKHLDNIEYVLIENQISPIANKMKTIQGMLAQLFIIRNVPHIEFISSVNKLQGYISPEKKEKPILRDVEVSNDKKNTNPNYKKHKKDGILYCQEWLNNELFCSWKPFFDNFKSKQDDLADSFLQGIWYFQKMNVLEKKSRG